MKIVVLGGGISTERQISLDTSLSVLRALRSKGHKAVFVDLFLGIDDTDQPLDSYFDAQDGLAGNLEKSRSLSDCEVKKTLENRNFCIVGPNVFEICRKAEFVFLGLHGEYGEDGRIQGALDMLGIPYNGGGTLGSAIAMDKAVARRIMQQIGIRVAPLARHAPCIVKPVRGGSSIGVQVCDTDSELEAVLSDSKIDPDDFLIEQRIFGKDVSVAVLGDKALTPIDLIPLKNQILDYTAKYSDGEDGKEMICPARISEETTKEIREAAEKIHKAMKLSVYSRTDFIVDSEGKAWCLEVNTLPGMTEHSCVPMEAAYDGIDFPSLCEMIVRLSLDKNKKIRNQDT